MDDIGAELAGIVVGTIAMCVIVPAMLPTALFKVLGVMAVIVVGVFLFFAATHYDNPRYH